MDNRQYTNEEILSAKRALGEVRGLSNIDRYALEQAVAESIGWRLTEQDFWVEAHGLTDHAILLSAACAFADMITERLTFVRRSLITQPAYRVFNDLQREQSYRTRQLELVMSAIKALAPDGDPAKVPSLRGLLTAGVDSQKLSNPPN